MTKFIIVWIMLVELNTSARGQAFATWKKRTAVKPHSRHPSRPPHFIVPTPKPNSVSDEYHAPSMTIDPLIYRALQNDEDNVSLEALGGIWETSNGLEIWRHALQNGRMPVESDFDTSSNGGWPKQHALQSKLHDCMVGLQLPRFTLKHPEVINLILLTLLRLTLEYGRRLRDMQEEEQHQQEDGDEDETNDDEVDDFYFMEWQRQFAIDQDTIEAGPSDLLPVEEDGEAIANDIAKGFLQEWNNVLRGVNLLDGLFGNDHGLLQVVDNDHHHGMNAGSSTGYGVQDGVWSHSGWTEIPKLQKELANVPELYELIQSLGRRPTAKDSDRLEKFTPRKSQEDGSMGAQFDPQLRESVEGITLSNCISEMLPSEAILLSGNNRKSPALRQLFLAKLAESKLLSYQLSGWTDIPSVARTRPLYRNRLPSAPGGPILVCLDTSWSMTGRREALSKAVVLACVSAAHQQGRDCQVVAFSNARGVMDAGLLSARSRDGIPRLLDFLSHSFGGGTDVTGALKYGLQILEHDYAMLSADLLLVTDGEIPDPPVSDELMDTLDSWKLQKGLQVHGLLIGKATSKPLSRLCTTIHDFLSSYDSPLMAGGPSATSRGKFQRKASTPGRASTALYAKQLSSEHIGIPLWGKGKKNNRNKRDGDFDEYDNDSFGSGSAGATGMDALALDEDCESDLTKMDSYSAGVDRTIALLRERAKEQLSQNSWSSTKLDTERAEAGSGWEVHSSLKAAIERVEDGLVERGEEARLVVLALIANEHILLLGSPGTAKSILGVRLAELCNGVFFQRLLTRFTTPEELFGPLSLSSLENDEYRRCTTGFLPKADVAFLDEIFKANSAILNTLLTILNERKFDNAGGRESCPIRCVVGASNELPENDDLVALFDRFLIRKEVVSVSDDGVFRLLSMPNPGVATSKTNGGDGACEDVFIEGLDQVIDTLSSAADNITMDKPACQLMRDLRTFLRQQHGVEISDRRLVKAARLLKISAASDGRKQVDSIDFLLLQHCFWNLLEQRAPIREWLWENITPGGGSSSAQQFRFLLDNLRNEILSILSKTSGDITGDFGARKDELEALNILLEECERLSSVVQQNLKDLDRHTELLRRAEDFLWIRDEDAKAVEQLLLPKAESSRDGLLCVAEDILALEFALSTDSKAPTKSQERRSVIEGLWEEGDVNEIQFSDGELSLTMREAKSKYDVETFRRWKRTKKRLERA